MPGVSSYVSARSQLTRFRLCLWIIPTWYVAEVHVTFVQAALESKSAASVNAGSDDSDRGSSPNEPTETRDGEKNKNGFLDALGDITPGDLIASLAGDDDEVSETLKKLGAAAKNYYEKGETETIREELQNLKVASASRDTNNDAKDCELEESFYESGQVNYLGRMILYSPIPRFAQGTDVEQTNGELKNASRNLLPKVFVVKGSFPAQFKDGNAVTIFESITGLRRELSPLTAKNSGRSCKQVCEALEIEAMNFQAGNRLLLSGGSSVSNEDSEEARSIVRRWVKPKIPGPANEKESQERVPADANDSFGECWVTDPSEHTGLEHIFPTPEARVTPGSAEGNESRSVCCSMWAGSLCARVVLLIGVVTFVTIILCVSIWLCCRNSKKSRRESDIIS